MDTRTVKVKGQDLPLAPLRALQVAAFIDDSNEGKKTTSETIRRSLRVVAQSLANANNSQGENDDAAIEALDAGIAYTDLDKAFRDVMAITGIELKPRDAEGEAAAAGPTTSESSAAS